MRTRECECYEPARPTRLHAVQGQAITLPDLVDDLEGLISWLLSGAGAFDRLAVGFLATVLIDGGATSGAATAGMGSSFASVETMGTSACCGCSGLPAETLG